MKKLIGKLLYDFDGTSEDELSVKVDDEVEIIEKRDDGWSVCSFKGSRGLIPSSYMEEREVNTVIPPPAKSAPTPAVKTTPTSTTTTSSTTFPKTSSTATPAAKTTSGTTISDRMKMFQQNTANDGPPKYPFGNVVLRKTSTTAAKASTASTTNSSPSPSAAATTTTTPTAAPPPTTATTKQTTLPAAKRITIPKPLKPVTETNTQGDTNRRQSTPTAISNAPVSAPSPAPEPEQASKASPEQEAPQPDVNSNEPEQEIQKPVRVVRPPPDIPRPKAAQMIQNYWRQHIFMKKFRAYYKGPEFRSGRMRAELIKEVIQTEKGYVASLEACVNHFVKPLKANKILDEQEIKSIFANMEQIVTINVTLLVDLQKAEKQWPVKVGASFKTMAPFFKAYTTYINNYDKAFEKFEQISIKNQKFAAFLRDAYAKPETLGHKLDSFLIMPVQRIPRYKMLLAELLKNTPENHVEYKDLEVSLQSIGGIATFVNETKRQNENQQIFIDLQKQLNDRYRSLVQPHRKFIRDTRIRLRCVRRGIVDDWFKLYLFSDMMLFIEDNEEAQKPTARPNERFSRSRQQLQQQRIVFVFFSFTKLTDPKDLVDVSNNELSLDVFLEGAKVSLVLVCQNVEDRNALDADIRQQIEQAAKLHQNKGIENIDEKGVARTNLGSTVRNKRDEYVKMNETFVTKDKRLKQLDESIRIHEEKLRQLQELIRKEKIEKHNTEQDIRSLQQQRVVVAKEFNTDLDRLIQLDEQLMEALLTEQDAFQQTFGDVPVPQDAPKLDPNILPVNNPSILGAQTAVQLPTRKPSKKLPPPPKALPNTPPPKPSMPEPSSKQDPPTPSPSTPSRLSGQQPSSTVAILNSINANSAASLKKTPTVAPVSVPALAPAVVAATSSPPAPLSPRLGNVRVGKYGAVPPPPPRDRK